MKQPADNQLRRWTRWSWGLILSSVLVPILMMNISHGVFLLVYPERQYHEHLGDWDFDAEAINSAHRRDARWKWDLASGAIAILTAAGTQLASLRFGMRLARHWPRALWWVVPQMVLIFSTIIELAVCLVFMLFGRGQTVLQLLAITAVTLPVVLIAVVSFTVWWTRSVLTRRKTGQTCEPMASEL